MQGVLGARIGALGEAAIQILLALTLFTLPLSSSLKSIFFIASLVAIAAVPKYRADVRHIIFSPFIKTIFALFVLVLVASCWSPANTHQKLLIIEKYSKLLYFPILMIGFQSKKARDLGIHAFLFAMTLTATLSVLKFHGFLKAYTFDPDFIFRNHIMTGIMVSFAAYLSALWALKTTAVQKIMYSTLAALTSYQVLFVNAGRTGYLIYFLLLFIFLIQHLQLKQMCFGLMGLLGLMGICYFGSTAMQTRVADTVQQLQDYQQDQKDSELGFRFQFHHFAYQLFKQHPVLGNGTASFTYLFETEKPVPGWEKRALNPAKAFHPERLLEPHSQYWLVASELGLLGICLFLAFLCTLAHLIWHLKAMRPIASALMAVFCVGNLSDSLFFYSGTGYFFLMMMALCLGEKNNDKQQTLEGA